MVKDRLNELKRANCYAPEDPIFEVEIDEEQKNVLKILEKFSEISGWILHISSNTDEMKSIIGEASFHYNDKNIRTKMESKIQESLQLCRRIHSAIKLMENEIDENDTRAVARIKRIQFLLVKDNYLRTYRDHEQFMTRYEDKIKRLAQQEAKIMSFQITDEETENLLSSKTNTQFFVGNVIEETKVMQNELREIMARHAELENLEKSLIELRDLFMRISTLVHEQGELIQVVEFHAQQASSNVDKGAEQLDKAKELKIKKLKTKTCILIWVSVILSFVIVILFFAP